MGFPGKRFGNVIADNISLKSDDTSVSVFLKVNGDISHTGVSYFGSDANFSGDVGMSEGTLTVKDVDVVSTGRLTIALGAGVDSDATDFAVEDMQVGGTLSVSGASAGLTIDSDASADIDATSVSFAGVVDIESTGGLTIAAGADMDIDATSVSFAGVVFVESTGSLRLEDTADYTSNAAAISAGYSSGDLYHAGSGVVKIVT